MILTGKSVKLGDNINTDFIISGRYKFAITDMSELAKHIMEDIDRIFLRRLPGGSRLSLPEIILAWDPAASKPLW